MNYTEEDIRNAFQAGMTKGINRSYFDAPLDEDEYLTKLKQLKNKSMKTEKSKLEAQHEQLDIPVVIVPLPVIKQVLKYCEDNQIYDKLGSYQNFYYKLNQIRRECEESNAH